jgi:hypothetical protein
MITHEPFEFLTFQLLGPPSDRCAPEFSLHTSSGPNSPNGELYRTPEMSRSAKRKAENPLSSSNFDTEELIHHNLYHVFATEILVDTRRQRLSEITDYMIENADSVEPEIVEMRGRLRREKNWLIENPRHNPLDFAENNLPIVELHEV